MAKAGVVFNGRLSLFLGAAIVNNPPLVAGDVRVIRSDNTVGNITTLPAALAGDTDIVGYTLSAAEMAGDPGETVTVKFEDQTAPAAWEPVVIDIPLGSIALEVWSAEAVTNIVNALLPALASYLCTTTGIGATMCR